jgi:hypothetical protein
MEALGNCTNGNMKPPDQPLKPARSHPVRRDFFSDQDLRVLQFEYRKIPADAFHSFLAICAIYGGLAVIGYRSFYDLREHYGWWKLGFIIIGLSGFIILLSFGIKRRLINKDLNGGIKIIQKREVVDKQKSFSTGKFLVWIKTGNKLKKFEVDHSLYSRLQKGQLITFEYAPHSKFEFKIHWYQ